MAREVTIVDAGLGNLASVERALIQVGAAVRVSGDPDRVATARMVVFPGQGAFGPATNAIIDGALGDALRMVIDRGDPFLGICLGMQMLFDRSEENDGHPGLGILPGYCRRFVRGLDEEAEPNAAPPSQPIEAVAPKREEGKREGIAASIAAALENDGERRSGNLASQDNGDEPPRNEDGESNVVSMPAPSIDALFEPAAPAAPFAPVAAPVPAAPAQAAAVLAPEPMVQAAPRNDPATPLRRQIKVPHVGWNAVEPTGEHYYFVHSYYVEPERAEDIMWVTTYGGVRFPAAVRYQNLLGCQFHPEKSQRAGLKFLRAFLLGGWG